MPLDIRHDDTKHDDLQSLRIDHTLRGDGGEPSLVVASHHHWRHRSCRSAWLVSLAYRLLASPTAEVEVVRATAESGDAAGSTVLSASGYIVAHHKISVNSKVTGRVAWIGVEKGDKVKEGQVLVRLEDEEFRAVYEQARGGWESAKARLAEAEHGSRPEEIQQADHNLSRSPRHRGQRQGHARPHARSFRPGRRVKAKSRRRAGQVRRRPAKNRFARPVLPAFEARSARGRDRSRACRC